MEGPDARKVQLWSDDRGKEFAVRLANEPDFRVASNPSVKYTKLVDESEYLSDIKYDWQFLLEHWVGVKNGSIKLVEYNGKNPDLPPFDIEGVFGSIQIPKRRRARRERPRPPLKCHYCMLCYNTEKERREHELVWHQDKVVRSGQTNSGQQKST